MRRRIYNLIEADSHTKASFIFEIIIIGLILLNVFSIILESFESVRIEYGDLLERFEYYSVIVFTIEYLLRLLTADLKYQHLTKSKAPFRFIFSTYGLIDFLAIMPYYLPLFVSIDMRALRILRLLRLLRVFKLNRYTNSLKMVADVFKDKGAELGVTMFIAILLLLISSTMMYFLESDVQPDLFPNIVAAFWWAITTITTVGYGDVYPITQAGKLVASFIAVLGIGVVALPTAIISSSFIERIQHKKHHESINCPHCHKEIDMKKI